MLKPVLYIRIKQADNLIGYRIVGVGFLSLGTITGLAGETQVFFTPYPSGLFRDHMIDLQTYTHDCFTGMAVATTVF
jgi:hypothetical protein